MRGDCRFDIVDMASVEVSFAKSSGPPEYNPSADLNK